MDLIVQSLTSVVSRLGGSRSETKSRTESAIRRSTAQLEDVMTSSRDLFAARISQLISFDEQAICPVEPEIVRYEEYEEEEPRRGAAEATSEQGGNLFYTLFEEWTKLQEDILAASKSKRKRSPKARLQAELGIAAAKERIIKGLEDAIYLEGLGEKKMAALDAEEAAKREEQLERTRRVMSRHWMESAENARLVEQEENWNRYMNCDGLPDPGSLADMNTFMHLWTTESQDASVDVMADTCDVIVHLLSKLGKVTGSSRSPDLPDQYVRECEELAGQFRSQLQRWIDIASYRLLRDIETNMQREDTKTKRFVLARKIVVCCVWAPLPLPVGLKRLPEKERKAIEVHFGEIEMTVRLPMDMDCYRMAIRGLWLSYDHYSVDTNSYLMPKLTHDLLDTWGSEPLDLLEFSRREHAEKLRIREEQVEGRRLRLEEKKAILESVYAPPVVQPGKPARNDKKQESDSSLETSPLPYLPMPNELIAKVEEENRQDVRRLLFTRCETTEVNLRKYRILGGVYRVDLIYQPPQPKDLGSDTSLTTLEIPKEPKFVPFWRAYKPPEQNLDEERSPEVVEAEMKAIEAAMEELLQITLKLPSACLWFEPPLIAHWLPDRRIWSTSDVHEFRYNEEKQTIAFLSGRLGIFGLAAYKYANLPFQSWELKPERRGGREHSGVALNVTAATVQAEFLVRDDRVCLNSFVGSSSAPLQHILGQYLELESLTKEMQQVGCDLFPERDAASYLKGLSTKHPIAEKHLRECMAMLSTTYTFSWSRWNATRGFREIVLQFKEVHGCVAKQRTNLMLLVTPSRTMRIQCTEVSSEFSDLPLEEEDSKFYADLYQLALNTAGIKSRLLMEQMSFKLVLTVSRLLQLTNVISMSS